MRTPSRLLAPLCLGLVSSLCSPALAAQVYQIEFESEIVVNQWPDYPDRLYTRTIHGEFTGDLDQDAFVIADGRPALLVTPEAYNTFARLDHDALDIAMYPARVSQDRDRVLTVGPDGLLIHTWESVGEQFTVVVLEDSAPWRNMTHVRVADVDGAGGADIVALSSSPSTELRILYGDGQGHFPTSTVLHTALPARRFELVDWQGDGELEIVAVTDWGLELYDRHGTPIANQAWSFTDIVLAVISEEPSAHQRVAAVVSDASGLNQYLVVWDRSGLTAPLNLGPAGIVQLVAGDFDDNGDDDLCASLNSLPSLLALFNTSDTSQATFSLAENAYLLVQVGDPSRDVSGNVAWPLACDFDHDGDVDVLYPLHDGGGIELVLNTLTDQDLCKPVVELGTYFHPEGGQDVLQLSLLEPAFVPPATTHVEMVVWKETQLGAGTQKEAFHEDYFPLATWPLGVHFEVDEPDLFFPTLYSVELRLVERRSGSVVAKYAATTLSYTQSSPSAEQLSLLPGAGEVQFVSISGLAFDPPVGGGPMVVPAYPAGAVPGEVAAGGIVDLPEIPEFPDDIVPDRPDDE